MANKIRYGQFNPENSDGCTILSWINKHILRRGPLSFRECCIEHDRAYWYGGTKAQRKDADDTLRDCISSHGHLILAWIMWGAVRLFGSPRSPLRFRWARKVTIIEGLMRGYSAGT